MRVERKHLGTCAVAKRIFGEGDRGREFDKGQGGGQGGRKRRRRRRSGAGVLGGDEEGGMESQPVDMYARIETVFLDRFQ